MVNNVRIEVRGGSGVELEVGALTRLCFTQPSLNLLDLLSFVTGYIILLLELTLYSVLSSTTRYSVHTLSHSSSQSSRSTRKPIS